MPNFHRGPRPVRQAGLAVFALSSLVVFAVAGCGTAGNKPAAGSAPAPAARSTTTTPTAAVPATVDPANRFKVTGTSASFYKLGPQQPGGPDLGLKPGMRLTLVRREFGYSQVQLEDGTVGYVGTEDIARLTPEEIAADTRSPAVATTPNANNRGGPNNAKPTAAAATAARRRLRPGPNIPIAPPDEPGLPAAPDPTPRTGPVPTFRY